MVRGACKTPMNENDFAPDFRRSSRHKEGVEDFATIGKRVRERRLRFGLSGKELATRAGVSRNTLVRLEAGQPISSATLDKVRIALSTFLDQLASPVSDEPFSVHRSEESRWNVSVPKAVYGRVSEDDDPLHVDDPAERQRLGQLGFQPGFTAVLGSELPGGIGSHAIMELYGPSWTTQHYGEEFVYCLRGSVVVSVSDRPCTLNCGDAMAFDATQPHHYAPSLGAEADSLPPLLLVIVSMRPGEQIPPGVHKP
ncbi:XRE family transcriptional regulator [bacterium]|nr:MAG: XRE family transcriptional regulator [bacterium]